MTCGPSSCFTRLYHIDIWTPRKRNTSNVTRCSFIDVSSSNYVPFIISFPYSVCIKRTLLTSLPTSFSKYLLSALSLSTHLLPPVSTNQLPYPGRPNGLPKNSAKACGSTHPVKCFSVPPAPLPITPFPPIFFPSTPSSNPLPLPLLSQWFLDAYCVARLRCRGK
jgi:hypothetical protein